METQQTLVLIALGLLTAFLVRRVIGNVKIKRNLPALLGEGAVIVDVRSPQEFMSGSNPTSINIPLNSIEAGARGLDRQKPVIVCCASGARSGIAAGILKARGFEKVVNAGSWTNTL